MKQKSLLSVMMAMVLVATSCSKSEDNGSSIPSDYVGTWTCNEYCQPNNTSLFIAMYAEDGYPSTTVTLNADGTCSGSGLVINGNGTWTIEPGDKFKDGYYAIITFYQNGKVVNTAWVESYMNDHRTGFVRLQNYPDKWFVFKRL